MGWQFTEFKIFFFQFQKKWRGKLFAMEMVEGWIVGGSNAKAVGGSMLNMSAHVVNQVR
jgi:hypothetical protein